MELQNKVIVITGASSGIGEATAKRLAKAGAITILTARREDELHKLRDDIIKEGGTAMVVTGDVTNKDDWKDLVDRTLKEYGQIDVLINNAGLMPLSYVEKLKTDEWEQMIDVNIKGVLNGVAAVLPSLLEQQGGHIINISSSAAHKYFPGGAVYCATKSAVKMFSEGLRQELAPEKGINVTSIEPGAVSTELMETITDEDILDQLSEMKEMTMLQSEDIAESIYYALSQPDRVNVNDVYVMPTEQKQ